MKILSKYKDYYDYLQGIYGMDEKIVLDRTTFTPTPSFFSDGKIQISVCGQSYEGLVVDKSVYWGEDIKPFSLPEGESRMSKWMRRLRSLNSHVYDVWVCDIPRKWPEVGNVRITINKNPEPTDINDKLECPIVLGSNGVFPILKDYNFQKVIHPETLWVEMSNWLSRTKDLPDTQTNKDKILSAGFDLKTSFRNVK